KNVMWRRFNSMQPPPRFPCLTPLRLEAGDSSSGDESPQTKGVKGLSPPSTARRSSGPPRFTNIGRESASSVTLQDPSGSSELEINARLGLQFVCYMPSAFLDLWSARVRSFSRLVVPEAVKQQIGVLRMKCFGSGIILKSGV